MRPKTVSLALLLAAGLILTADDISAKPKVAKTTVSLTAAGKKLEARYADMLADLQAEISRSLPSVDKRKEDALKAATAAVRKAEADLDQARKEFATVNSAKGLVEHAKGKWIGGAEKGIASAEVALTKAKTTAERKAAQDELAKWQKNKEEGLEALAERQVAYEKAQAAEPKLRNASEAAEAALVKAKVEEVSVAKAIMAELAPVLSSDKLDAKLAACTVLAEATPAGLAEFAQQGRDYEALVSQLLGDAALMEDMLVAGGAAYGKYGRAMEIYTAIRKASPKANARELQRLALATALEHAVPIARSNPKDATDAPATLDPVERYKHYETAYLNGELDPAFKNFNAWEYRHVVNCDAPDEILAWGREMLRTYRPDHISNPNYGWRYVAAVKSEVPYGSQNVKLDDPALHNYQNIAMNGGVCGRRAFFGRFILRSFGIPTWGVTQRAHAAVSHWTPGGWVVNLGTGFEHSWWDKDDVPLSGTQFLVETQAREHGADFLPVLRARWVSRVLGEPAFNERKKTDGGFWSGMARYQAVALASRAVTLGPLGQELGEANEPEDKQKGSSAKVTAAEQKVVVKDGSITIPAVACEKPTGKFSTMKSHSGGMQVHAFGGFKARYVFDAPQAGKYMLTAMVATVQTGQTFLCSANSSEPIETPVPYTLGKWLQTQPVEISLERGKNVLDFELSQGSRGVTIKDFIFNDAN